MWYSTKQAVSNDQHAIMKTISLNLTAVYEGVAAEYERNEKIDEATKYYEKCINAARRAGDVLKESECTKKIGQLYQNEGDTNKAIEFFSQYLKTSKDLNNRVIE